VFYPSVVFQGRGYLMFKHVVEAAYLEAERVFPLESCGIVVSKAGILEYMPCQNISSNAENTFTISPRDYVKAEDSGDIVYIIHSHSWSNSAPSEADKVSCNQGKVPWLILSLPERSETLVVPNDKVLPLEGRTFFHGVIDCLSLVRDYYSSELGIHIDNYYRQDNWWDKGLNMYLDLADDANFDIITSGKPKVHDVIVMQVGSPVPNHGAIYLGNNIILHHLANRNSCKAVYGGYWEKNTWAFLRHRTLNQENI